jgi:hypothetical protein
MHFRWICGRGQAKTGLAIDSTGFSVFVEVFVIHTTQR